MKTYANYRHNAPYSWTFSGKGHLELRVVTSEKNTGLSAGSVPCRLTFPARMDPPRKTERTQDLDG